MKTVYLESSRNEPEFNLAFEEYVFNYLPRENNYFMLWQNENAVVVGKNQNTIEEVNSTIVSKYGVNVIRRISGGGAVYHDSGNINFTFIQNTQDVEKLDFKSFCTPMISALQSLGVKASVSGRNDMMIKGRKFSGNAQYVSDGRVMHHGTLLYDADLLFASEVLNASKLKIMSKGTQSVRSRITNIREHIPKDMDTVSFKTYLKNWFFSREGMELYSLTEDDISMIEKISRERYQQWEWNYGESPPYNVIKRRRFEGCGEVQARIYVDEGKISSIEFLGDFFGQKDCNNVSQMLVGCRMEKRSITSVLAPLQIGEYFNGLKSDELIELLAE